VRIEEEPANVAFGLSIRTCQIAGMSDDTITAGDLTFAEFSPASREQWLALVSGVLEGAPFEQRLMSRTYDGIAIAPLYARDPASRTVPGRTAGAPWRIVQRIDFPDAAAANAQALHDLENGATGLALVFAGATGAYGFGLRDGDAVARVLDGVFLDAGVAIEVQAGPQAAQAARQVTAVVARRGMSPGAADVAFGFDPLGDLAAGAADAPPWRAADFAAIITELAAQGYRGPFAVADGRVVHNAGGSEAQELAWALAAALAYLRALEARGIAVDDARRMIGFRLAADADQFLTMAKFRALRRLWARVEEACGLVPAPAYVAAETAWRMMTRRDPYVNMLRATVAVAAAGLGGADSIAVVPHTAAIGLPDGFARRIARNTQLILLEESNLARVADPAAGAAGLESLTHELSAAAWALFQDIEQAGGAAAALEQGLIQAKVAAVRAERERAVARRKDALTGTSEFPDIAETPVEVLMPSPLVPGTASVPSALRKEAGGTSAVAGTLPCRRLAEPFEALRDASDRVLATTGVRPTIFLANLGRLADFTARATYVKNFFEAGGIEAMTNDGFITGADMLAAFKASGAKLTCLCGSDETYAAEAVGAAEALRAAAASHIYLAGRPGPSEATLRAAGVGTFIYIGCDVVATLTAAYDRVVKEA
jgi:methylmalonyl-CoA mutase